MKNIFIINILICFCFLSFAADNYFRNSLKDSEERQITTNTAADIDPVFLVQEERLIFSSDREGSYDLYAKELQSERMFRLTDDPNQEREPFIIDEETIGYLSNSTDVKGDLFQIDNKGTESSLIIKSSGEEKAPCFYDNKIYFSRREGRASSNKFYYFDIEEERSDDLIGAEGDLIVISAQVGKAAFVSSRDINGINNLFMADLKGDSLQNIQQITYDQGIVTGAAISANGKYLVFSMISNDSDGDGVLTLKDNGLLYAYLSADITDDDKKRVDLFSGRFGESLYRLTTENYDSRNPCVTDSGEVYFVANKKGNKDIWKTALSGRISDYDNIEDQIGVADYLYNRYRFEIMRKKKDNDFINDLLYRTLYAYRKVNLLFSLQNEKLNVAAYLKEAEIHQLLGHYTRSESVCRRLLSKYRKEGNIAGDAELRLRILAMRRKNINYADKGFQMEDNLNYLDEMKFKYANYSSVLQKIGLLKGEIYFAQKRYDKGELELYTVLDKGNNKDNLTAEIYYWLSQTVAGRKELESATNLLVSAVKTAVDPDQKDKFVKQYYKFMLSSSSDRVRDINSIVSDKSLPVEIRSYGNLLLGNELDTDFLDIKIEKFDSVKKIYVRNSDNPLLSYYSAQSDLYLANLYLELGMREEAVGVLEFAVNNYSGIKYNYYYSQATILVANIYLKEADAYFKKNEIDKALISYSKAFDMREDDIKAVRGIVKCYNKAGNTELAVAFFEEKLLEKENDPFLNYGCGFAYSMMGVSKRDNLIDYDEQLIEKSNDYLKRAIEINYRLAYAYLGLGYNYEALFHLKILEDEERRNLNFAVKTVNYIISPLRSLYFYFSGMDDNVIDYSDMSVKVLEKGLSVCGRNTPLYQKFILNLANGYYNLGEYGRERALYYYLQLFDGNYQFSTPLQEAIVSERTGHCYFTVGDMKADQYYIKAGKIYEQINDRESSIRVALRSALLSLIERDYENDLVGGSDAADKYKKLETRLESEGKYEYLELLRRNLGYAYLIDLEPQLSTHQLTDVIDKYEEEGTTFERGDDYIILSLLGFDLPVMKLNIQVGASNSDGFNSEEELALLYSMQTLNSFSTKDFAKAEKYLQKELKIFQEKENKIGISLMLNKLGLVSYYRAEYDGSYQYFYRSNMICKELNLNKPTIVNQQNMMKCLINSKNADTIKLLPAIKKGDENNFEPLDLAVLYNLRGVYLHKLSRKGAGDGALKGVYNSFRYLLQSEKELQQALTLFDQIKGKDGRKGEIYSSILYNLSLVNGECGYLEKEKEYLSLGISNTSYNIAPIISWRFKYRLGMLTSNITEKYRWFCEAEEELADYLPEISDYELYNGWKKDIKPLYDNLIELCIKRNEIPKALNYGERYRKRIILNLYSSKYLDLKLQTHIAHIKKIRDNNREITLRSRKADRLAAKDSLKYSAKINKLRREVTVYDKELKLILSEIDKKNDTRLLQFVNIGDTDLAEVRKYLQDDAAALFYHSLTDSVRIFMVDKDKIESVKVAKNPLLKGELERFYYRENCTPDFIDSLGNIIYQSYLQPLYNLIEDKSYLFLLPDFDYSLRIPFNIIRNKEGKYLPEEFSVSKLFTLSSLLTYHENSNINNQKIVTAKSLAKPKEGIGFEKSVKGMFENGGLLFFDKKLINNTQNPLENSYTFGEQKSLTVRDLLKYKMENYLVMSRGFNKMPKASDLLVYINTLNYGGIPTILLPARQIQSSDSLVYDDFFVYLHKKIGSRKIDDIILTYLRRNKDLSFEDKLAILSLDIYGNFGMDGREQKKFAVKNLKEYISRGNRYYKLKRYSNALYFYNSALVMAKKSGNKKGELNLLALTAAAYSRSKRYSEAIEVQNKLIAFNRKLHRNSEVVKLYDAVSKNYLRSAEYDSSAYYQKLYLAAVEGVNLKKEIKSCNLLSIIYSRKGDYDNSILFRKRYLSLFGLISDEDDFSKINHNLNKKSSTILFSSLKNLMNSYYSKGKIDSALQVLAVIENENNLFRSVKKSDMGKLYEDAGRCYFAKSFFDLGEKYYLKALKLYQKKNNLFSVYQNLTDLYYRSNDLKKAEEFSIKAAENVNEKSTAAMILLNNTRSLIEVSKGDLLSAEKFSYLALEKAVAEKEKSKESVGRVNLAKILISGQKLTKAALNIDIAVRLAKETNNMTALTAGAFYKGEIFRLQKNSDRALASYLESLAYAKSAGDQLFQCRSYLAVGNYYSTISKADSALVYLNNCREKGKLYNYKELFYKSSFAVAQIEFLSGNGNSGEKILEELAEEMEEDVHFFFENRQDGEIEALFVKTFDKISTLKLASSKGDEVIKWLRKRDYLLQQNDLNGTVLRFADEGKSALWQKLKGIVKGVKMAKADISSAVRENRYDQLDSLKIRKKSLLAEYTKTAQQLREFAPLMALGSEDIKIERIKEKLNSEDYFITYIDDEEKLYCMIIGKNGIDFVNLGKIDIVAKELNRLYGYLGSNIEIESTAEDIYKLIFKPLKEHLKMGKNLIFYGNNLLQNFPFEILYDGEQFLIDNYNICEAGVIDEILAVSNSNESNDKNYLFPFSFVNAFSATAANLEFADKEFQSLKWEWPKAKAVISKKAQESFFYKLKDVDLFHFPTHSYIGRKDSVESYIQLVGDRVNDGKLTFNEIIEQDLSSKDIVLSGCDTGGKPGYAYRDYYDLSSSFMMANSVSVISSRWKADDLSSAVLMKRYFRYLKQGKSRIEALSEAKRIVKKRVRKHPYYWAGFKLRGDWK